MLRLHLQRHLMPALSLAAWLTDALADHFGERWAAYSRATRRLLPGVW